MSALQMRLRKSRKLQVLAHDVVQSIEFLENRADQASRLFVCVLNFILKQFDIERDGAERIPDFMRDLGGEAPDRRKPFRLNQPLFHRSKIGAILKDMNESGIFPFANPLHRHVDDLSSCSRRQGR